MRRRGPATTPSTNVTARSGTRRGPGGRRTLAVLFVVLFLPAVFAGCASGPEGEPASCEERHQPGADETWLRVLMRRPVNAAEAGFTRLWVTPEAIGLRPADAPIDNDNGTDGNGSADDAGEGLFFADGITDGRRDWLITEDIWYEGMVTAGDYDYVRISVDPELEALRQDGAEPEVRVRFDRLTITHPDTNQDITLPGGQCYTILHEPIMIQQNPGLYEITDQIG